MCVCDKLGRFPGLLVELKGDRDGLRTDPSYNLDAASNDEKGNKISHREDGGLEQVYLAVFRSFAAFLQSVKRGEYKGLGDRMQKGLSGY